MKRMNFKRSRAGLALRVVSYEVDAGWLERIHKAVEKESSKGPGDVIVIDHIEMPTPN